MQAGVVLPFFDAPDVADAAWAAEDHGWDGLFLAEAVWGVDAWVALTAAAMRTTRLRLGTMLTPLARVKPWDLASRAATLDRLSGGRVQVSVGLGALHEGWTAFEAPTTRGERVRLVEEGLAVYDGLMRGQPFGFAGERYQVSPTEFCLPPPPVQRPRVPVWLVGAHPGEASLRRAARWDGVVPNVVDAGGARGPASPAELLPLVEAVRSLRAEAGLPWEGYDVVAEGVTPAEDRASAVEQVEGWRRAGATWWLESDWSLPPTPDGVARLHRRLAAGPPLAR